MDFSKTVLGILILSAPILALDFIDPNQCGLNNYFDSRTLTCVECPRGSVNNGKLYLYFKHLNYINYTVYSGLL